jgi:malyl-CoA/(S)-citramalyl-CoA lyase
MAASKADVVNLDLEDAVAPDDKVEARKNVIQAINDIDWGNKTVSVRINGLDTHYWVRDVVDLMEQTNGRLDMIMVPKAGNAKDIYAVDSIVSAIEQEKGREKRIGLECIIETAAGLAHVEEIAAASPRMQAMSIGPADYAAFMGMSTTAIGGTQVNYAMIGEPGDNRARHYADPWHYPTVAIVAACRTHGLLPVDGPFGDFSDPEGFKQQAMNSATLGMVGKWAIHPSQVELANEVFTPTDAAVTKAKRIIEAMEEAQKAGAGAVSLDGKLIDLASIRQAEVIVKQAEMIAAG